MTEYFFNKEVDGTAKGFRALKGELLFILNTSVISHFLIISQILLARFCHLYFNIGPMIKRKLNTCDNIILVKTVLML